MKRWVFLILGVGTVYVGAIPCFATGEEVAVDNPLPLSQDEMTRHSMRDQISALRQERLEKMPYLDRGFIRKTISSKSVHEREAFITDGKKTLAQVIERAIGVHTPAVAAHERINLAKRRILGALRELFPEMNLNLRHRDGSLGGTGPFNSESWRYTFTQPVFRGGILWNTFLQEKSDLLGAKKQYDQVLGDLINDVSAAYFEYNRASEVVTDQQAAIEGVRRFADLSEQKWKEELISEIEYLNVQSLFSQMQYDYENAKHELELAQLELQGFLNIGIDDDLVITELYSVEELMAKNNPPTGPEGLKEEGPAEVVPEEVPQAVVEGSEVPDLEVLVDLAYQNRPELQVEASKLRSARLEERIQWGELIPHVDLTMEFGKLGEAANEISLDPKLRKEFRLFLEATWNAAGNKVSYQFENDARAPSVTQFAQGGAGTGTTTNTVTLGVLDGMDNLVEIKEAEVERLDQIEELENAEKEVIKDVKTAYFNYQRALIQVRSTSKRVAYRSRLLQLARHRLDNNEVEISEYLQAEIDLLRERTDLHEALETYFAAKAELNRGVGIQEFLAIEGSEL